jgi:prepilin-type N-terminal cleavage/methylation domain-containing protein
MDASNGRTGIAKQARNKVRGFTLLELMIVVVIAIIAAGWALLSIRDVVRNQKAERALQQVLSMTRTARQLAIDRRRVFMVTFNTSPSQMVLTVTDPSNSSGDCAAATSQWPDSPNPAAPPTPLLGNFDFAFVNGAPNTTTTAPDGFAGGSTTKPIAFTSTVNPTSLCFFPDGSARDSYNAFNSGVVYLAPSAKSESSATAQLNNMRAMTVFGATGRISGWRLSQASSGLQWKMW